MCYKNERRQVNKKFFELQSREYRDGIKRRGDKIGMGFEAEFKVHIELFLNVQGHNTIPILSYQKLLMKKFHPTLQICANLHKNSVISWMLTFVEHPNAITIKIKFLMR